MLRAIILVCSIASAPQVADCTMARAFYALVTTVESSNPATCFLQGQAYLAATSLGVELAPTDRVRVMCVRVRRAGER